MARNFQERAPADGIWFVFGMILPLVSAGMLALFLHNGTLGFNEVPPLMMGLAAGPMLMKHGIGLVKTRVDDRGIFNEAFPHRPIGYDEVAGVSRTGDCIAVEFVGVLTFERLAGPYESDRLEITTPRAAALLAAIESHLAARMARALAA